MIRQWWSKLIGFMRRESLDREFDTELEDHLAMLAEENVARGMTREEAVQAARRSLGNVTQLKEAQREARGLVWLETLAADLKYAARMLRMNPGFTLVAVLTLTVGIGVVTTVFNAYNAVALKTLPLTDAGRVVRLERWFTRGSFGDVQYRFSYPEYEYCRAHNDAFSRVVLASWSIRLTDEDGEKLNGQLASANYFGDLDVAASIGRTFSDEDGADPVLVLSYAYWQRRFHGDTKVIGRVLHLNGASFTIVGVAAKEFPGTSVFPQIPDFWTPVSMQQQIAPGADWLHTPNRFEFQILARLKPGAPMRQAESETAVLIRQFDSTFKQDNPTSTVTLQKTALFGNTEDPRFQAAATAMMLIVGMVLLIGCANIANMLLARGASRQKEISVRLALGASRGRVIRQLLTESLLLAAVGGAGGLLFAVWTSRALWIVILRFIEERFGADVAVGIDLSPDFRVLAYAMALSLIAGLMFGLSPAIQFSRLDLTSSLKQEGGFGGNWKGSRLRSLLIGGQVTASMVLLISAGLLLRGLSRAEEAEPGFDSKHIYIVDLGMSGVKTQQRMLDRLRELPSVQSATFGTIPLLGTWTLPIAAGPLTGRTLASYASGDYFEALRIPLVRGRTFTPQEGEKNSNVAVVSEATVRRYWPSEDPIGKRLRLDLNYRGDYTEFEVIGIAKDVRFASLSRIDPAHVYVPVKVGGGVNTGVLATIQGDPRAALSAMRSAAAEIDPKLRAGLSILSLEEWPVRLQRSLAQISAMFASVLAMLALALAAVGIYGVMSYLVNHRLKEIGIRVALGARANHVLLSVVLDGLRPVIVGLVLGIVGAAALSAVLHSTLALPGSPDFLYGVPFYDPATFLGLPVFLILLASLAAAIPARRALKVDPMIALRYE